MNMLKLVLALFSVFGFGFGFFDSVARAETSKFRCESTVEELKLITGLTPSRCHRPNARFFGSHLDLVSAVFVTCSPTTDGSCLNIAEAIVLAKTGAKMNVLASPVMLKNPVFQKRVSRLQSQDGLSSFQVLPVRSSALQFLRDPFFFESQNGVTAYRTFPNPHVPKSNLVIDDAMAACRIASAATVVEGASSPSSTEAKRRFTEDSQDFSDESSSMGGNILVLPNGTVAIGRPASSERSGLRLNSEFIAYFADRARILDVELPQLHIGHIDEIFNLAPNPKPQTGECDFALLRASPREMDQVLKSRKDLPKKVQDTLLDPGYSREVAQMESVIERSTRLILADLSRSYPNCRPRVVNVPTLFQSGFSVLPNAVNGLHVNGFYFVSKPGAASVEKALIQSLSKYFPKGLRFVETSRYDLASGGIHCATQNISILCRP